MRAGRLNKLVTIEQPNSVTDAVGQPVPSWSQFAKPWARIEPITGREWFAESMINSETTVKITIRYRDGITEDMRVNWNSKLYNIEDILNVFEKDRELILLCSEGANDG